jgi:hypothetical protein
VPEVEAPDDGAAIIALDLASRPILGDRLREAIADRAAIGRAAAAVAAHVERVTGAAGDAEPEAVAVAWAAVAALGWLAPVDEPRAALAALPWHGTGALVALRDRAEIELDVAAALRAGSYAVPRELGRLFAAHWLGDAAHATAEGRAAAQMLRERPYDLLDLFDELARHFPAVVHRFEARLVAELPPDRTDPRLVPAGFQIVGPVTAVGAAGIGGGGALVVLMVMLVNNDAPGWVIALVATLVAALAIGGALAYLFWLGPREARYKVARLATSHGLTAECIAAHLSVGDHASSAADRILHREHGLRTLCAIAALAAATAAAGS